VLRVFALNRNKILKFCSRRWFHSNIHGTNFHLNSSMRTYPIPKSVPKWCILPAINHILKRSSKKKIIHCNRGIKQSSCINNDDNELIDLYGIDDYHQPKKWVSNNNKNDNKDKSLLYQHTEINIQKNKCIQNLNVKLDINQDKGPLFFNGIIKTHTGNRVFTFENIFSSSNYLIFIVVFTFKPAKKKTFHKL